MATAPKLLLSFNLRFQSLQTKPFSLADGVVPPTHLNFSLQPNTQLSCDYHLDKSIPNGRHLELC